MVSQSSQEEGIYVPVLSEELVFSPQTGEYVVGNFWFTRKGKGPPSGISRHGLDAIVVENVFYHNKGSFVDECLQEVMKSENNYYDIVLENGKKIVVTLIPDTGDGLYFIVNTDEKKEFVIKELGFSDLVVESFLQHK